MGQSRIGIHRARATRPASVQPNSAKTQFPKKTYASPGPCSRLTACQTPKLKRALLHLSHRPSDGLEIQNQLICGSPTDGAPPKPVSICITYWATPFEMVQRLTRF